MSGFPKFYLNKRPNGVYYIRILESDGSTHWKSTKSTTKSSALAFLRSLKLDLDKRPKPVVPHLADYLKLFELLNKPNLRPKTLLSYHQCAQLIIDRLGDKPLGQYQPTEFERLRALKITEGWSITTANIFTRSVKALFGFAVRQNIIESHPLQKVRLLKQAKRSPAFLTLDELKQVITFITNPTVKDIVWFVAFTGLRLGEVVNLKKTAVDTGKNCIHVANTDTFTTKSGRERIVGIHPCLVEVINRQRKSVYLFSKPNGYKYTESRVSHLFKRAFKKSGISKEIHFHSLRHTFASWAVQNGVDIYTVQALLGHSSVATTSIYSHLEQSNLQSAVAKLPS